MSAGLCRFRLPAAISINVRDHQGSGTSLSVWREQESHSEGTSYRENSRRPGSRNLGPDRRHSVEDTRNPRSTRESRHGGRETGLDIAQVDQTALLQGFPVARSRGMRTGVNVGL